MNDIVEQECTVSGRSCYKIVCNDIVTGLVAEIDGKWRFCKDVKGEFWSLEDFTDKGTAVEQLIVDRKVLDEFRVEILTGKQGD